MICHRSQEIGQSDESIDKVAATMILGDDASLLDDPAMSTINVDHVRQKLKTLVRAIMCVLCHSLVQILLFG